MNNFLKNSVILLALLTLVACDNSSTSTNSPSIPIVSTPVPDPQGNCPSIGELNVIEMTSGQCQLDGTLTSSASLDNSVTWFLQDRMQIGNATAQVTLTIAAGTEIRGSGTDHVLVFPGSAMQALGTAARPVRFLSDDDDVQGSGEWGGVFIRGFNGLTNLTGTQGRNILDYVVIAEAGAAVQVEVDGQGATYADNLVLNGVDASTILTFVQSHQSARDGVRIQNGDPRLSWILITGAQRDGIWYRDFNGLIKDLMVIHDRDSDGSSGRSGIYASETEAGDANPRIVNATLVGRDSTSVTAGETDREFGILFADNTDQVRFGNILIANFRNGCYEAASAANLSEVDTSTPGPNYFDGIHCANEAGANSNFGVIRQGSSNFPDSVVNINAINGNGLHYYNGSQSPFIFTGEIADRRENFTASWYLNNIGGISNGLLADTTALNAFLDGDTNDDGVLDTTDASSTFFIADDGTDGFNQDVAADTGGYDLTHIGAVRGGSTQNTQFDGWTVATGADDGFVVQVNDALIGASECPTLPGAEVVALERRGGRNVCQVSGVIDSAATLTSNVEWQLEGRLQVGDATTTTTFTIQSGTRIYGDNVDVVDHLLVYPGSAMQALGTAARPVRFLSDDDDVQGSGEWGGVFIRGFNGLTNLTGTQGRNILDYVVIAEAGAAVQVEVDGQGATYADNLVLNGVDASTILTFVQSHQSARDGVRIQNGDPRLSWILITGAQRDGIWYRDFNGLIKDLMVIHDRDSDGSSGRSGIYASETEAGDANPRIVNATLVGRDSTSVTAGETDREFGILFADNTDQVRFGNILIANFRNGCYEAASAANLSEVDTSTPGPNYFDGIHCANEAGANSNFGIVRDGSTGFPSATIAANNSNGDGLVYYNGAGGQLAIANTDFNPAAGGINFTGELDERGNNFTAGWYLNNIRGLGNGLIGNLEFLNGFLDGDTNSDGVVDSMDNGSSFIVADDGQGGFNQDVADDTGGYDLTHIGSVRGGAVTQQQFDNWTVETLRSSPYTVRLAPISN